MFVRTERLFLRPGWPEDLDDLLEALSDEEIQRNVAVSALPKTAREVREYLEKPRDPRLPHFFMYLRTAEGPQLVGGIGFAREGEEVEMGYWIVPRFRGHGFASEAVRAILGQARSLGHSQIYAKHFADSGASARVLESAGFRDTGRVSSRYSVGRNRKSAVRVYVAELEGRTACAIEPAADPLDA